MANTLILRLEGPLQAWGERARWGERDTATEPTKSAIVGLLGCALGLNADDDLHQLAQQIRMGVRCDQSGELITDFHTVVGGVLSAEGKIKKTASTGKPETVVSRRQYLCDASFLVAVQSNDENLIQRAAEALQNPHWPVFLGRKSCPPSQPIYFMIGDYPDLGSALQSVALHHGSPGEFRQVRAVLEDAGREGIRRRDETGSNRLRTFLPRYVKETLLELQVEQEE